MPKPGIYGQKGSSDSRPIGPKRPADRERFIRRRERQEWLQQWLSSEMFEAIVEPSPAVLQRVG